MPITIGTNISSLRAQRALGLSTQSLSFTFERLSSGQRINKASDDAAGLSIAESLRTDTRVFSQAMRNVSDGVSLLNIADSAVAELSGVIIRIRELASQSANGTFSAAQRKALDEEAQALAAEFFRVSRTAEFNGQALFDGSLAQGLRVQAGYGIDGSVQSTLGGKLGTGSFGANTTYLTQGGSPNSRSNAVEVGDLNGDGVLDMVTAGTVGYMAEASVLLGRGDGSFGPQTKYLTEAGLDSSESRSLALGDLNNDGILDLVTAGEVWVGLMSGVGHGLASVRLGNGDGTFAARATFITQRGDSELGSTNAVTLGDLNGDGILDLIAAGWARSGFDWKGEASVLLGRGDGTFGSRMTYAMEPASSKALALGDLNGDGILDIVTAGYSSAGTEKGQVSIRLGRGDGTFGNRITYATETGSGDSQSSSLALGDINGDGVLDLVTAGTARNGVDRGQATVLLGLGDGTFGAKTTYATDLGSNGGRSMGVELGDINGDGCLDLTTAGYAVNGAVTRAQASVFLGRGDGTFGARATFVTGSGNAASSRAVCLADANGDGISDLVAAGNGGPLPGNGEVSVLLALAREGIAPILPFSLTSMAEARQAMGMLDRKLDSLSTQRGVIGAFQSRLQTAAATLTASRENFFAAAARIMDANVAQESSDLLRTQILQQAGAAVLAQANQQPALALRLLGG